MVYENTQSQKYDIKKSNDESKITEDFLCLVIKFLNCIISFFY
jgi:hypothetical protein